MIEPTSPQLATAARTFGLLLAPVRLHLVALASCGEYDVGTLAARVGVSVPTASQHLAKLRLAGLVSARREGRRQFYTVDDPHVIALVEQIFQHVAPDGSLAPDPPRPGSIGDECFPLSIPERDGSLPPRAHRTYGLRGSVH
ncbi:ArsR/SmtB family transcription factor [Kribbella sindirgiensis]|uniref:Transcriptional regulator n=1 Tax=Kribbella sindirgiensis TaxID=1124744 RepID=A0A4R0HYT5_9ACTN|nr:metalloregulator ArsR/SmtB family transcription factor [Kribbella sindirgiensis]TCC16317.1 transcriptional regulator [Kribbella sindirgiensis]